MLYTTRFSEDRHIETSVYDYSAQGEAQLPLLTDKEREQILVEWNATKMPYPQDVSLPQLIEEQVARTPDAVALMYENTQLTYRELNARANQLACYLRQLGVGPEVLVGVCVERSLELVVALLGILKAGGAYVPLDPAYPAERIAFMLSDAQVPVLITQHHLLDRLPAHQAHVVCMDTDASLLAQQSTTNLTHTTSADNVAYVIYTSGSTGRPKGVQVLQGGLVNLLLSMRHQPGLTAEDRLLAITTFSFDIAALEFFLPLIVGASVIIASQDVVKNGAALLDVLKRSDVTVMQATPVTWQMLLAAGWQGSHRLRIISGGEALSVSLARQLLVRVDALWNLYGPTETTIYSSGCKVEQTDKVITIGRPIANTSMYILDEHLQPVPIGVAGELYIGGDGLARGYLHRPDLTSERFIQHPFEMDAHARLYKTGDLARYLPDGRIECLGRIDHQVKIRGFRIELGEIEAQLASHSLVRQCVVVARDNGSGDKQLVAYVVLREKQNTTCNTIGTELRDLVQKALPDYMMPSAFVELEALPQTPNGKVDRLALPAPETARQLVDKPFVAPTTLGQLQLQRIWEELLDVRPIGMHDNFFHIGGHSLLAAKLVTRIEQESGKRISLQTLFAAPTIEQLVLAMQTEKEKSSRIPLVPVQAGGKKAPFFYLHGAWDSDAFYCFQLSKRLGPDQPFYALPPYDFTGLQVAPSIEEMAAAHIQSIRTVQPQGPYALGGFCNGGLIAYEMARQLVMQGEEIERLVLVVPAYPTRLHMLAHRVIKGLGTLLTWSKEQELEYFFRFRHVYKYIRGERKAGNLKGFRNIDPSIFTLKPTTYALLQDDNAILDWTITEYDYPSYDGDIELIWAREESFHNIWRRKAAQEEETRLHVVPGSHIGCRTDHIQTLSETVAECVGDIHSANPVDSVNSSNGIYSVNRIQINEPEESQYGANISV